MSTGVPVVKATAAPTRTVLLVYSPTSPAVALLFVVVPLIPPDPVSLNPAKGIFAVIVVCPSFVTAVDRPVAMSDCTAFITVLLIVVPVTKGVPGVYKL